MGAGSGVRFEAESTYTQNFPGHAVEPRRPPPPAVAVKNPARFDGTTTNGATYTSHPIEPRQVSDFKSPPPHQLPCQRRPSWAGLQAATLTYRAASC